MSDLHDAASARGEALLALKLGGRLSCAEVEARGGLAADAAVEVLQAMVGDGLAESGVPPDGLVRYRLTPAGKQAADNVVEAERASLSGALEELIEDFDAANARLKELLHRWQLRPEGSTAVVNDHSDAAYDDRLLAELGAFFRSAEAWLARLPAGRPRYDRYRERLRTAVARAGRGEIDYVSGLSVDSVHSVWWQLHADLLAVLGRARADADA